MPKIKKIYTKVLYISVTPAANDWARKQGKRVGYSMSRYIDELIRRDFQERKRMATARVVNFG